MHPLTRPRSDGVEPGRGLGTALEGVPVSVRLEEHFLHEIRGFVGVAAEFQPERKKKIAVMTICGATSKSGSQMPLNVTRFSISANVPPRIIGTVQSSVH